MAPAAPSKEAPSQHKQPSRKGKKAWRKNVDVTEVQDGLETVRDEVIRGGVVAEKPSDALFTLDTSGSQAIKKEVSKLYKPLKADEILAKRSAVPAVDNRKRRNVTDGIIEPVVKKRKSNGLKPEDFQKLKLRAYGGEAVAKDLIETDDVPSHDPWVIEEVVHDPRFSYLERKKPVTAPKSLRKTPISLLEGGKHIPAVTKPKPGTSYNPDFADWEKLLTEEGQKEVEAEKKRIQEAKEEEERQARIEAAQYDRDDLLTEDESVWEGIESEFEGRELSKKRPERKTPSERNKVKRRKEAERQAKHNAEMKRREELAKKIREIAKEVNAQSTKEDLVVASDGDDSEEEIDDRNLRRRKLGKVMLPERDLELVLPDELKDSLRLLKPEGNLLKDRFRSILVRGKVEARKAIQQPKKKRRMFTEKWTYKDFTVSA